MKLINISLLVSCGVHNSVGDFYYGQPEVIRFMPLVDGDRVYENISYESDYGLNSLDSIDLVAKRHMWERFAAYEHSFRIVEIFDEVGGLNADLYVDITNISSDDALMLKLSI